MNANRFSAADSASARLSTPVDEREIDEIVEATERAAVRLAAEGA